jgi:DnaJ like chaperone protein
MPWERIKKIVGRRTAGRSATEIGALCALLEPGGGGRPPLASNSAAFTIAVIALSAKMAKADGVAVRVEAEVFNHIYRAPPAEAAKVKAAYDRAKADTAGFESYADQIATMMATDAERKRDVFEALFAIAAADGIFHGDEEAYLKVVADRFGYTAGEYRAIRALFVHDESDPYVVLGIGRDADDDAIKRRYRSLVRDHHPDGLTARGVPLEFLDTANRTLATINAAYDEIRRERGL